jgi:hypothetical protein
MASKRPQWNTKHARLISLLRRHKNRSQYIQQFLQALYDTLSKNTQTVRFTPHIRTKLDPTFTASTLDQAAAKLHQLVIESAQAYHYTLSPHSHSLESLSAAQLNTLIRMLNAFIGGTQDSHQTVEQQLLLEQNPELINMMQLIPRPTPNHANDNKQELELEPQPMLAGLFSGLFSLFLFFMDFCIDLALTPTINQRPELELQKQSSLRKTPRPSPFKHLE